MRVKKEKKNSLLNPNLAEVHFTQQPEEGDKPELPEFTVVARASGVKIFGTMYGEISSREELDEFAQVISAAWVEHDKLSKGLKEKIKGK